MQTIIRQSENQTPPIYQWLGRREYSQFLQKMQQYVANFEVDTVWFCEHEHVFTTGRRGINNSKADLGAPFVATERGGETTYHGLGQLMMYPIVDLKKHGLNVRDYVHLLEESVIQLLQTYDLETTRDCGLPGVWLNNEKIAALGIRVSKGIAWHGMALNTHPDLTWFEKINPCGTSRKATSIQAQGINNLNIETLSRQWFDIFTGLLAQKKTSWQIMKL
ncbi:MAG: lipoyl(octanoyl) transferase LipB [Ghiorsea sp.]|nr:lipoyl(octanoyl) transferase LipB [Ghiorsea sp.]